MNTLQLSKPYIYLTTIASINAIMAPECAFIPLGNYLHFLSLLILLAWPNVKLIHFHLFSYILVAPIFSNLTIRIKLM